MKLNFYKHFSFGIALLTALLLVVSCNRNFDAPPIGADPNIPVTMTIKELKALYEGQGIFKKVTDDKVISGIVTVNDKSGNFYKQIIIQDESGAIPVRLDANSVYTSFPVGRKLYIKVKNLMLGDYGGTIQLGLDSVRSDDGRFLNLGNIPAALFDTYIFKGTFGNTVVPKVVSVSDFTTALNDPLQSMLVQLNDFQFSDGDAGKTYADAANKNTVSAVNYTIRNCENKSIILRNSSYETFAAITLPAGNGSISGVYSLFNGTKQFFIRDTGDVKFNGIRCSDRPVVVKTIADIISNYAKGDSIIPAAMAIEGLLVSDAKNEAAQNYRFQDATGGIQIRTASASDNPTNPSLGDKFKINVSGLKISEFQGGLQIAGITSLVKTGNATVTPRVATIAEIKAAGRAWESTVVKINNITFTPGSTTATGQNFTIKDATGEMVTFIRMTSGIIIPDGATAVNGYISLYKPNDGDLIAQLTLRKQEDIEGAEIKSFNAVYDFGSVTNTSGTTDPTQVPTANGVSFGSFKAVNIGTNSSGSGRFSFSGWPTGATNGSDIFTGAIDDSKYFEVTITPQSGKSIDLSAAAFTLQRSGTGVRQCAVRSSIDGFTNNLTASINPENAVLSIVATNIFQVTDAATSANSGPYITLGTAFKGLTTAVTFRFYGINSESASGTFSIDNVRFEGKTN